MLSVLFALDGHSQETMMQAHEQQEVTRNRNHSSPRDLIGINQGPWDPVHHRAPANQTEQFMVHHQVKAHSGTLIYHMSNRRSTKELNRRMENSQRGDLKQEDVSNVHHLVMNTLQPGDGTLHKGGHSPAALLSLGPCK